METLTAIGIG